MTPKTVHWGVFLDTKNTDLGVIAACGNDRAAHATRYPADVTCKSCRRTEVYRDA